MSSRRHFMAAGALLALGTPLSAEVFARIAAAAASLQPNTPPLQLSAHRRLLVGQIADVILPATDTPGATQVGVVEFIELMLFGWFSDAERNWFLRSLDAFERRVRAKFGRSFDKLPEEDRLSHLQSLAAAAASHKVLESAPRWIVGGTHEAKEVAHAALPFIQVLKGLTLYGYYTSQRGASEELMINVMPGSYDPNARLKPGDRAPADDRHAVMLPI